MTQIGKTLLVAAGLLAVVGAAFYFSDRVPALGRVMHSFGRLPGDFTFKMGNGRFYFPFTTCLILSLVATAVMWFIRRR